MTKLLLLGGNGVHNREWIEEIQRSIGGSIQYYDHWSSGADEIDFDVEARKLFNTANGDPINVFAKSAGCLVVLKAVRELGLQVEHAIFIGTAVNWGIDKGIPVREWLKAWRVPTLFVHKANDKVISAKDLQKLINNEQKLLVIPGDNHDYFEFDQYIPQTKGML